MNQVCPNTKGQMLGGCWSAKALYHLCSSLAGPAPTPAEGAREPPLPGVVLGGGRGGGDSMEPGRGGGHDQWEGTVLITNSSLWSVAPGKHVTAERPWASPFPSWGCRFLLGKGIQGLEFVQEGMKPRKGKGLAQGHNSSQDPFLGLGLSPYLLLSVPGFLSSSQ